MAKAERKTRHHSRWKDDRWIRARRVKHLQKYELRLRRRQMRRP